MVKQKFFEDFQIGETYQIPSKTMHDGHFLFFAGLTGDAHPIHYDDEYCKKHQFGKRVAHGLLLMTMTALGGSTLSNYVQDSMVALLSQSSSFFKPVFIGDTIYPELEIRELIPKEENGVVKVRAMIRNQKDELVLEGEHVYLIKKKPATAD